jgi:hypothetical protein
MFLTAEFVNCHENHDPKGGTEQWAQGTRMGSRTALSSVWYLPFELLSGTPSKSRFGHGEMNLVMKKCISTETEASPENAQWGMIGVSGIHNLFFVAN